MPNKKINFGQVEGDLSDKPVFIVGGGPSLDGFDFNLLKDYHTIGCNKSAIVANTDILLTVDIQYACRAREEIQKFQGYKVIALRKSYDHEQIDGVTYVLRSRLDFLSTDPKELRGLCTGYGAINLAYLLGAKEINLLGFDGSKGHFHGGYYWNKYAYDMDRFEAWNQKYIYASKQLTADGIKVTNYIGPQDSRITAFDKRPLDDLYHRSG